MLGSPVKYLKKTKYETPSSDINPNPWAKSHFGAFQYFYIFQNLKFNSILIDGHLYRPSVTKLERIEANKQLFINNKHRYPLNCIGWKAKSYKGFIRIKLGASEINEARYLTKYRRVSIARDYLQRDATSRVFLINHTKANLNVQLRTTTTIWKIEWSEIFKIVTKSLIPFPNGQIYGDISL